MTRRRLRVFDPRVSVKSDTGIRVCRPTLAVLEECRAWLLQQMWENKELRPEGWNGKLSQDEALAIILFHFHTGYGIKVNSSRREEPCPEPDKPA